MALRRIMKQKQKLSQQELYGIKIKFNPNNLFQAEALIDGPEGTPYVGGKFLLKISIPKDYPFKQPKICFNTPIYHPGLTSTGSLCCCFISISLHMWSPAYTIQKLIEKYRQSLYIENIDFSDCSNFSDALYTLKQNREQFFKNAQCWTKKYASKNQIQIDRINLQCNKCKKIIGRNENFCYFNCGHHFHRNCFNFYQKNKICFTCQIPLQQMQQMQFYMNDLQNQANGYFINMVFSRLRRLLLVNNSLTSIFIKQLASCKLQSLQVLDLSSQISFKYPNCIKDQGFIQLSKIYLPNLQQIYLGYNNISDIGIQSIYKMNIWQKIKILDLQGNILRIKSIKYLTIYEWKFLKILNLSYMGIGSQGIKFLTKNNWINLCNLKLTSCNIKDQGINNLSKGNWYSLNKLQLSQNDISDIGVFYLSQFNLPLLVELNLNKNKIKNLASMIQNYFVCIKRLGLRNK